MAAASIERTRGDIGRLSHRGLGVRDFSLGAARLLRRAIDFAGFCVMTMDPATLLPTGHVIENGLPDGTTPRLAEIETMEPDFNKFTQLARAKVPAATLSAATGGQLDRSARHRELRGPNGYGDELRAGFATDTGTWGGIVLMREAGDADFTGAEVKLVASVSGQMAEGLKRATLLASLAAGDADADTGLLLLAPDHSVEMTNAAAQLWIDDIDTGDAVDGLPFVVHSVADTVRNIAAGRLNGESVASARVRTRSGRWVQVRGSMLGEGDDARALVMIEAARRRSSLR